MTILAEPPQESPDLVPPRDQGEPWEPKSDFRLGRTIVNWLTSTDHKIIGYLYLIQSFVFFIIAGIMALVIRAELTSPGLQFVSLEQYNQLFTMHGTIMLFLFATNTTSGVTRTCNNRR